MRPFFLLFLLVFFSRFYYNSATPRKKKKNTKKCSQEEPEEEETEEEEPEEEETEEETEGAEGSVKNTRDDLERSFSISCMPLGSQDSLLLSSAQLSSAQLRLSFSSSPVKLSDRGICWLNCKYASTAPTPSRCQ
jgi:hypothetical protein